MNRKIKILFLFAALLPLLSCGVYTFSSSALGDVKTVAVPLFENQTTENGLRERLTDQLSQALVNDNTLRVVRESQADAIIRGVVVSYSREAYTYSRAEVVSEYICRIGVDVRFENRRSGKALWEDKNLSNWGTYDSSTENDNIGKDRAVAKLVEDILNKTVRGW